MKLSHYFSLYEAVRSSNATRLGIDNTQPPTEALEELRAGALLVLDPLRESIGRPITVNSAYRCRELNDATPGSSPTSQHMLGQAWDIEAIGFDNLQLAKRIIELALPFDQLLLEGYVAGDMNSGWVHVSHRRHGPQRGDVKTVTFRKGQKPITTPGLPGV